MALVKCTECGREISDQAAACPHCGATRVPLLVVVVPPARRMSGCLAVLLTIAVVLFFGVVLTVVNEGGSPSTMADRIADIGRSSRRGSLAYLYAKANVRAKAAANAKAVTKLHRGDSVRWEPAPVKGWSMVLGGNSVTDTLAYVKSDLLKSLPIPPIEIASWSWYVDPEFAGNGPVIWTAVIRNKSGANIRSVSVAVTTYDAGRNVLDTDFGYATGLGTYGGIVLVKGFATYFGREKYADIQVNEC